MPVDSPHDLYGLPLDQFITERTALTRSLRAEKRRDEAGEVTALRKPSVAAWAVNQLIRTQAAGIRSLFAAGDDLARAQSDASAGRPAGDAMRDASRRLREITSELVRAAEGLLSSDGHPLSQTTLERVTDTLRAAAIDEQARAQVKDGCLTQELRFVGLGITGAAATEPPPSTSKAQTAGADRRHQTAEADRRHQTAETERRHEAAEAARRHRAALDAAREARADAAQRATRAEREREAAQAHREEAAAALKESEQLLTAAQRRFAEAATELENAERALLDLEGRE